MCVCVGGGVAQQQHPFGYLLQRSPSPGILGATAQQNKISYLEVALNIIIHYYLIYSAVYNTTNNMPALQSTKASFLSLSLSLSLSLIQIASPNPIQLAKNIAAKLKADYKILGNNIYR